jgi:hypothetical protein
MTNVVTREPASAGCLPDEPWPAAGEDAGGGAAPVDSGQEDGP